MKGTTLDNILSIAILILLIVLVVQRCNPKQTTINPDSYQTIVEKLQTNFDSTQTDIISTIQTNIESLDSVMADRINVLTDPQSELLNRVIELEGIYKKENKELKQFLSVKTYTADTITEQIYITDTSGTQVIVPQWFKDLPWQLRSTHVNELDYVNVFYDLLSDSVTTEILIHNDFEIEQYEENGESFVRVNNKNPKTYTLPGSSSFNLDLPLNPTKYDPMKVGFQFGVGVSSDFKPRPYIGFGLTYSPKLNLKNIFKRKN